MFLRKQRSLNVEIGRVDVMLMYFWLWRRDSFADVDWAAQFERSEAEIENFFEKENIETF